MESIQPYRSPRYEKSKRYRLIHKDELRTRHKDWRTKNIAHVRQSAVKRYQARMDNPEHRDRFRIKRREYQLSIRRKVITHYGSICACCGEGCLEFMSIDHVENNGAEQRRQLKNDGGYAFYLWLIRNDYPAGYQVLCHNCNMAKGCYGICPHKREKDA